MVLMSESAFSVLGYVIIAAFVLVNLYITCNIVKEYGFVLGRLFWRRETR